MATLADLATLKNCFISMQPLIGYIQNSKIEATINSTVVQNFCSQCSPAIVRVVADPNQLAVVKTFATANGISQSLLDLLTTSRVEKFVRAACVKSDQNDYCLANLAQNNLTYSSPREDIIKAVCNTGCCLTEFTEASVAMMAMFNQTLTVDPKTVVANACFSGNLASFPPHCQLATTDTAKAYVTTIALTGLGSLVASLTAAAVDVSGYYPYIIEAFKSSLAEAIGLPLSSITVTQENSALDNWNVTFRSATDLLTDAVKAKIASWTAPKSFTSFADKLATLAKITNPPTINATVGPLYAATVTYADGTVVSPKPVDQISDPASSAGAMQPMMAVLAASVVLFGM